MFSLVGIRLMKRCDTTSLSPWGLIFSLKASAFLRCVVSWNIIVIPLFINRLLEHRYKTAIENVGLVCLGVLLKSWIILLVYNINFRQKWMKNPRSLYHNRFNIMFFSIFAILLILTGFYNFLNTYIKIELLQHCMVLFFVIMLFICCRAIWRKVVSQNNEYGE